MLSAGSTVFFLGLTCFLGWWTLSAHLSPVPQKIDLDGRARIRVADGTIVGAPYGTDHYNDFVVDQMGSPLTHQKFEVPGLRFQRTTFRNDHFNSYAFEMPLVLPASIVALVCLISAISFWLFRRLATLSKPPIP